MERFVADRNPVGRPQIWNIDDIAEKIVTRLMDGETIPSICRDDSMPSRQWLNEYRRRNPEFDAVIRKARSFGADMLADLYLDVSLGGRYSSGDPFKDRNAMEGLKWYMGKRNPKDFGNDVSAVSGVIIVARPTSQDGLDDFFG